MTIRAAPKRGVPLQHEFRLVLSGILKRTSIVNFIFLKFRLRQLVKICCELSCMMGTISRIIAIVYIWYQKL